MYNIKKGDLVLINANPWSLSRANRNYSGYGLVLNVIEDITDSRFPYRCVMATIYTYTGKTYDIDVDYLEKIE